MTRFIFQNEELPSGPSGESENNTEKNDVTSSIPLTPKKGKEKKKTELQGNIVPPNGENMATLHYRLHGGYKVKLGDTLSGIIKNKFKQSLDYNMPVDYQSNRIENSDKPITILQTNVIYPGQYIVWTADKIVIADEPFYDPSISKMSIYQKTSEKEEREEEKSDKQKNGSDDIQEKHEMGYEYISGDISQRHFIEQSFRDKCLEAPKKILDFMEDNDLKVESKNIYVHSSGFAAFPLQKNILEGGAAMFTVIIDYHGHIQLFDENLNGVRKADSLQEAYDMTIYNAVMDHELVVGNRSQNDGIEHVNRYLTDKNMRDIVEMLGVFGDLNMYPVSPNSQRLLRKFTKYLIYKTKKESFGMRENVETSKLMKTLLAKNEDEQGEIQKEKIREIYLEMKNQTI